MTTHLKPFIFSIGRSCHTAMHLQLMGLQDLSYPFDYLIPSVNNEMLETRVQFIINGFKNFLNKKDLELYPMKEQSVVTREVRNKYSDLWFIHDFSATVPFDKNFKEVKNKYNRRTKRFMRLFKKSKNIYMIYMQNTWDHPTETYQKLHPALIESCLYKLRKKYPDKKISFIYFIHDHNMKPLAYIRKNMGQDFTVFLSNHTFTKDGQKLGITLSVEKIFKEELRLI